MLGLHQRSYADELRHGGRTKTKWHLQLGDSYCALGVACLALESEHTAVRREDHLHPDGLAESEIKGQDLAEQPQILAALGLRDASGEPDRDHWNARGLLYRVDAIIDAAKAKMLSPRQRATVNTPCRTAQCSIVSLNDYYDLTFREIADVITEFSDLYFIEAR